MATAEGANVTSFECNRGTSHHVRPKIMQAVGTTAGLSPKPQKHVCRVRERLDSICPWYPTTCYLRYLILPRRLLLPRRKPCHAWNDATHCQGRFCLGTKTTTNFRAQKKTQICCAFVCAPEAFGGGKYSTRND